MIFRSIRWRIAVPFVVLVLVAMIGLGAYLSNNLRQVRLNNLEERLYVEASMVGETTTQFLFAEDNLLGLDELARRWSAILGSRVTIIGTDGVVLGESDEDRTTMDNHITRPEIIQAGAEGQGISVRFSQTVGYEMMYSAVTLEDSSQEVGFVRVALPVEDIEAELTQLRQTILVATLAVGLLTIVLATFIAERTTLPLRQLTSAAEELVMGDVKNRLIPPTRDEIGQLTRAFNAMAVRLQSEFESLDTERAKLASVLQQMTDGVVMVDPAGQVQLINLAAEKIFGVTASEAVGDSLVKFVRHHQLIDIWQKCRDTKEEQVSSYEFGQYHVFLQVVAIPFTNILEGNVLLLFQDLTQVRRLETIRRDFISNISHELRTPLASLKALVETLLGGALEEPPASRRFLGLMENEVDLLTQMVQELLELTRIESGRVPLQLEAVSPAKLMNAAIERLHLQADRAGLTISVNISEGLPDVLADSPRLEQVLVNLLHNAIKFTPEGGEIEMAVEAGEDEDDGILFIVKDSGVGIPPEDLPRIFERFFKADRARAGGGTGLGLAIARHLVHAHRGKIWAESVEGQGSTFFFNIPTAV